jgi:SPFH domain / Band 7 family
MKQSFERTKKMQNSIKPHISVSLVGIAVVGLILWGIIWLMGSSNPSTPAGYMGYVTQGAIFGKTQFITVQTGPTSPGRMWLGNVLNVSITPYTFDEDFSGETAVMSKDNNKLSFSIHFIFRVKPTAEAIKKFVEKYTTLKAGDDPDKTVKTAYGNFIKEQLRTYGRNAIQKHGALQAKENIVEIGKEMYEEIKVWVGDDVFEVMQVAIGNIQLPPIVSEKAAQYVASEIENTRLRDVELPMQVQKLLIMKKQAEIRNAEAQGIADAMDKVRNSLTPAYLQYEAIKAQAAQVGSPNHTIIYIPVGPMGVPIVGNLDLKTGIPAAPAK